MVMTVLMAGITEVSRMTVAQVHGNDRRVIDDLDNIMLFIIINCCLKYSGITANSDKIVHSSDQFMMCIHSECLTHILHTTAEF